MAALSRYTGGSSLVKSTAQKGETKMDTNSSLNRWLRTHQEQQLVVQYSPYHKNYTALLEGADAPELRASGPDVAAAVCNLNALVAALRVAV